MSYSCGISRNDCGLCIVFFRNGKRLYVKTDNVSAAEKLSNNERLRQKTRIASVVLVPSIAMAEFEGLFDNTIFVVDIVEGRNKIKIVEGDLIEESWNNCGLCIVGFRNKNRIYVKTNGTKFTRVLCNKERLKQGTMVSTIIYIPRLIMDRHEDFYENTVFCVDDDLDIKIILEQ